MHAGVNHMEFQMSKRTEYTAPRLNRLGSLEKLTLGSSDGYALDATFPINTPKSDLTFS